MSNIILALYVLITSAGLVVLKLGANSGLPISYVNSKLQFNLNPYTVTGLVMYAISFVLYVYLVSKNDLGYIIPLAAAFVYILIFTASYFVFKESFTTLKIAGIMLILAGIVLLSMSK